LGVVVLVACPWQDAFLGGTLAKNSFIGSGSMIGSLRQDFLYKSAV